jgi:hypothetical protein
MVVKPVQEIVRGFERLENGNLTDRLAWEAVGSASARIGACRQSGLWR